MKNKSTPDFILLTATLGLLAFGVVMVYSSSAVLSFHQYGDAYYFTKRQLIFAGLGLVAMFFLMNAPYWLWKRWSKVILLICFALLVVVLIPGVGLVRGGARSWLGIGAFSIQPSEFAKLGMILYLSQYLSMHYEKMTHFIRGVLPPLGMVGVAFALIMLQPDLGTGTVLVGASMVMIFTAGMRLSHLFGLGMVGIAGFAGLILAAPYRIKRITAFLDPWQDPLGSGYQLIQSLYAIGPGGLVGLGLGMSRQKFSYVPEPQTDFIFSILAEELGFIGAATVILLFLIVVWRGMRVAITAPDLFGSFLAVGIVSMIAIQVIVNIGVVTGMFPVTGITLPFISYGGSSLTLNLTAVGILLNVSRYAR